MTADKSPQPISPLRARMIEDMTVRGFKEDTRRDYVRHVRSFTAFIGRSPDTATAEERRLFYVGMTRAKDRLILSRARQRHWRGCPHMLEPSPFLRDIENELVKHQPMQGARAKREDRQLKLF